MITYDNTKTVREMLEKSAEMYKDAPFLRYEREDDVVYDISYEKFCEACRIVGAFVNERRTALKRRIHVGLLGSAGVHYITVLVGVMASGNVAVPLDPQMDIAHLEDCLNRADVDILFFDWEQQPVVEELRSRCGRITDYYSLQSVKKTSCLNDILKDLRFPGKSWGCENAEDSVTPDDPAMILYTSGTTGHSKGVILTNFNLVGNALAQDAVDDPKPLIALLVLPIHHVYCIDASILAMMHKGAVVCINGPLSQLGRHLRMFEPVVVHVVPMMAKALYNKILAIAASDPSITEEDALHQVYGKRISRIVCGGGGLPKDLGQCYVNLGLRIGQGYGMSECSPVISQPVYDRPDKLDSAGKVMDHVEIRIAEGGEVQVRSPFVMKGYYGDPELTEEAFTEDGWLHTGDIGYLDEENFLYLTGRLKNLIILSNGENVAPEEMEADLSKEPLVSEVLVFEEDDMIKCEVYPDFSYAESIGLKDVVSEIEGIVKHYNRDLAPYKRIMQTGVRKIPFKKTTSKKIIREEFFKERTSRKEKKKNLKLPENDIQKKVYDCCLKCLGHGSFGVDADLYTEGLDSFTSILLLTALQDDHDYALTLTELMENPTVEKIAALLEKKAGEEKRDYSVREKYPLTRLQMYFAYVMRGNTTANLPFFFKLGAGIDLDRMEDAIRKLFKIHPILTDRIQPGEDKHFYNFRDDTREAEIERLTLTEEEWGEKRKSLLVPYTYMPGENLYHIGLYQTEDAKYLFFDVAHIIGDGMTMSILLDDLNHLYLGDRPVRKSEYSFYEFILDEYARDAAGLRDRDIAFFKELLSGLSIKRSILAKMDSYDLNTAHNASIKGRFKGLNLKSTQGFCAQHGISENALFMTAFSYTVGLFASSDDVAVTSIHNGRTDGRWARLAGSFFGTYVFRYTKVAHETVDELLRRNAGQILHTMETHMSSQHADEMFIQYQGTLLDIPQIGGERAEGIRLQLDSLPFHLMVYSDSQGYTYELRYWENRFDRNMLEVFLAAMEDVLLAMPEEDSARKLKDHLSARLYPKHFSISASRLNAFLGYEVITDQDTELMVKPYILDEYGLKKPFGAWGRLYILDHEVNEAPYAKAQRDSIESLYTPGTMFDTGIYARITPDKRIEAMYQAGRTVMRETLKGRYFINLFELERTLEKYPGIDKAEASLEYGENNLFYVKAAIHASGEIDGEKLKAFVAERLGAHMVPEILA
ncbi:MAG: AMP-binding protein [Lachnospiraceae bacterium]|nr:AMP-binding protein [Lachnospiraceae bacterium]